MNDADADVCREVEEGAIDACWDALDAGAVTPAQQVDIVRLITDPTLLPVEAGECFDGLFAEDALAESPWLGLLRAWVGLTAQVRASAETGWVGPRLWKDAA